jgi:hypothetical protein
VSADQWITKWKVCTQTDGGGSSVTFLQGKQSGCDRWIYPVQAGGSSSNCYETENLQGFTELNGIASPTGGLSSFLGMNALYCRDAWGISGSELSLDPPARVAGYQARIADTPTPHIDSVRFLFRSYAEPGGMTACA